MVCADQQGTGQFGWAQICRAMSQSVEFPQQASIAPVNDAQSQRQGIDRIAAARAQLHPPVTRPQYGARSSQARPTFQRGVVLTSEIGVATGPARVGQYG